MAGFETRIICGRDEITLEPKVIGVTDDDRAKVDATLHVNGADISTVAPLPVTVVGLSTESPLSIMQQPTVTAGAYTAGDAIGGLLTFAAAARMAGGGGTITKITIIDDAKVAAPIDIVFFDRTFTPTADNAPFDPSDSDMENCIGYIHIADTDYITFNDNAVACRASGYQMPLDYDLVAAGTSLFAQMVVRSAPTYAATGDLTVKIVVQRA